MAASIHRFYVEREKGISRTLAIISCLASLASMAVAWLAPEFRGMSILAAVLSLVVGMSWWRASHKRSSGPRTIT